MDGGKFVLLNIINKYKVSILWTISIMIFIGGTIIAQFKPFSAKGSGVVMWFSFNSALLAMLITAVRKGNKNKIIYCIVGMIYITYKMILRFVY